MFLEEEITITEGTFEIEAFDAYGKLLNVVVNFL